MWAFPASRTDSREVARAPLLRRERRASSLAQPPAQTSGPHPRHQSQDAADRIERTLATVEKMERFRGHLYNWYDTRSLRPLEPLYVSSVDSGNLAGYLLATPRAGDRTELRFRVSFNAEVRMQNAE